MCLCFYLLFFYPLYFYFFFFFFFNDTATTEIYTLSLHDALPIYASKGVMQHSVGQFGQAGAECRRRSEEHTSELQSRVDLVCRLLLEKKKKREADGEGEEASYRGGEQRG